MTAQEFEKVYEQCREGAIQRATTVRRLSRAAAEDAVQEAAIYCLENLGRFQRITPSYFYQLVVNRAKNIRRSEDARAANRERSVGDWFDLADVEADDFVERTGQTPKSPTSDDMPQPLSPLWQSRLRT